MIKKDILVDIDLKPEEIAAEFASMGASEQARFFNELATITEKWDTPFSFQLQYITDDPDLTDDARIIMEKIGDYAYTDRSKKVDDQIYYMTREDDDETDDDNRR